MDKVTPKKIASPWSGSWSSPKLRTIEIDGKVIVEAWWYCPDSGRFITKGIVSETLKESKKKHD